MKKLLSLILLGSMLTTALVSCTSESTTAADTTTAAEENPAEVTEAESDDDRRSVTSTLDDSLDFNGTTINTGYTGHIRYVTDVIGADDGDLINTAVYERNLEVEEFLNVKFNMIQLGDTTNNSSNAMRTAVLAGDDLYDICSTHQHYTVNMVFDGLFVNMADDGYISYESPWWAYEYMKEIIIGDDRIYFLSGDISLMMLKSAGAVYFNKGLFENYHGSVDDFYADVMDGKWTLDMLYEYSQKSYDDLNGDGTVNDGDLYGIVGTTSKAVEHLQYDAGIRTTERDADGIPVLILNNEKTIRFAEKLYNLYYNNKSALVLTDNDLDTTFLNMFKSDRLMFNPSWFYTAELLRDMESDFGIIPYPKLDEEQDAYKTLIHDGSTVFVVPVTISDAKHAIIGAVLEEMAFQSYKIVTPAYFEVALKDKYSRDNVSARILDIIYSARYTDFGYCYYKLLNNIGMLRPLAQNKTADFSSWYAAQEAGAKKALDDLVKLYLEG